MVICLDIKGLPFKDRFWIKCFECSKSMVTCLDIKGLQFKDRFEIKSF